ncbi:MAG: hypothetical protein WC208_16095 [Gallionella sp.]|jgi:hypothetical protein
MTDTNKRIEEILKRYVCDECAVENQKVAEGAKEYCCYCERRKSFEADIKALVDEEVADANAIPVAEIARIRADERLKTLKWVREKLPKEQFNGEMKGLYGEVWEKGHNFCLAQVSAILDKEVGV